MNTNTALNGLLGGSLIGSSAATLLLFNGDIMGSSGLISSIVVSPKKTLSDPHQLWKPVLLTSFAFAVNFLLQGDKYIQDPKLETSQVLPIVSPIAQLLGGFCVGFGTRLANGCTTGHGVCGMARRSIRSWVAVPVFMASATLTVTLFTSKTAILAGHTNFLRSASPSPKLDWLGSLVTLSLATMTAYAAHKSAPKTTAKLGPAAAAGTLFASGLAFSGMIKPTNLLGFLNLSGLDIESWNPALVFTLGGAVITSVLSYEMVGGWGWIFSSPKSPNKYQLKKPIQGEKFSIPTNKKIDYPLVVGSTIFGIGFGLCGLCPGPSIYSAIVGDVFTVLYHWPGYFVGAIIAQKIKDRM